MKKLLIALQFISFISFAQSVSKTMLRLPDTGETTKYTTTAGEDADYSINPPYFTINGDGTVTDTVTGLMWQQTDGGEMTIENARIYVDSLTLGGHSDWRLPSAFESFSILNEQHVNPAVDPAGRPRPGPGYRSLFAAGGARSPGRAATGPGTDGRRRPARPSRPAPEG